MRRSRSGRPDLVRSDNIGKAIFLIAAGLALLVFGLVRGKTGAVIAGAALVVIAPLLTWLLNRWWQRVLDRRGNGSSGGQ